MPAEYPPTPPPSWTLLGSEPLRAALEYALMRRMDREALPRGDGHPVVIFPGLATDERSTAPLHRFCESLGYPTLDWGRGFNTGPRGDLDAWLDMLAQDVVALTRPYGRPASLIGWSLGGIYAREVAKRIPGKVRRVITIGTPFAGTPEQTNVAWLYRLLNGESATLDESLIERLRTPPDAPTTSIFSRSDGIVAWQACVQGAGHAHTEDVEIDGSHVGMGWNPDTLSIVADRLSTPA